MSVLRIHDDEKPPLPDNFLQPGPDRVPADAPRKQ